MTYYRTKYFNIREFVPQPVMHQSRVDPWTLLDARMLITADRLRERFGPLICNNWHTGGRRHESGWRYGTTPTGAAFSQHKFGRALDLISRNHTAEEMRQVIFADPYDPDFEFITCIEINVSWLHIDCRNWDKLLNGILQIKP